jgi:hypothetical protein
MPACEPGRGLRMRFHAVAMCLLAAPAPAHAQPVSPRAPSVLDFGAEPGS